VGKCDQGVSCISVGRGTIKRLKKIEAQGDHGNWYALAWLPEKRYPAEFAKPEVPLNIGIQNNLNASANGRHDFESVVVSDLEFLKLCEHQDYQHHAHERPARDLQLKLSCKP
jgi:hypothetical protein